MDITPPNFKKKKQGNISDPGKANSIYLSQLGQKVSIDPKRIKEACAQAAKNAHNLGETNDEEAYQKDMEDLITKILKEKEKNKR